MDKAHQFKRIEVCQKTREIAANSCLHVLNKALDKKNIYSEVQFRDAWMRELNNANQIAPDGGWYNPPPFGVGVLFGNEAEHRRVDYPTLRPEKYWPRTNIFFQNEGLGYLFASPYSLINCIPIIGDFGFTFYIGNNKKIIDHYNSCWDAVNNIFQQIKTGMLFNELYALTLEILSKFRLTNSIMSSTDKSGTDVGHCIPFIDRDPNFREWQIIKSGNSESIHQVINQARKFINIDDEFQIEDNSAFTFEPRMTSLIDKSLPMVSFHTIILIIKRRKMWLTNFDNIYKLLGMGWFHLTV